MTKRERRNLEVVAYHEAGHFVAAYLSDHVAKVRSVSIKPSEDSLGRVRLHRSSSVQRDAVEPDLRKIVAQIGVCVAGPIAGDMFRGRANRELAGPDYRIAAEWANEVSIDWAEDQGAHGRLLIRWVEPLIRAQLRKRWWMVEAVAAAVLEQETITGKKALAAIHAAGLKHHEALAKEREAKRCKRNKP